MGSVPEVEKVTAQSVWRLLKETACRWNEINAPRLGAALAFYTMLSLAPLLVVSIGIAGLLFGEPTAQSHVVAQIQALAGEQGARGVQSLLDSASQPATGIFATGIGLLFLLFGASGVFGELRDSLNLVWGVRPASGKGLIGLIQYRFVSFAMVLGIGFLLLVSLVFTAAIAAVGGLFGGYLPVPESVLQIINTLLSFVAVTALFALLYKLVPDIDIEWRDVWIGAAVTSLLFSVGKFLIGLYLGKASIGSAYGAAGSLVVLLVWVYYSAQIFFLGAEFTHTFSNHHGSRAAKRAAHQQKLEQIREQAARPKLA